MTKLMTNQPSGPCAILGASGHGKVIAEIAELNGFSEIHFYDDRWPELSEVEHWQIYGNSEALVEQAKNYSSVIVAIGDNSTRLSYYCSLFERGASCLPLVHPSAVVSRYASLDLGTVIMAGAVVNPFCRVGKACIINTAATVDHDCVIEDGVHLSPGVHVAGGAEVAMGSWLGIGCQIKQLIKIGSNAVIGAGAAVVKNVHANQTVVGVPAKPIRRKE